MTVSIRQIEEADIDGFRNVLDLVARERRYLSFLEAPPPEAVAAFVRGNIAKGHVQLVAASAGEVIGWCDVLPRERPIHAHCGVLGMGLLPAFRDKGHGRALIRAAVDASWQRGMQRIELTVHASNARAIALYQREGFAREGLFRNAIRIDGRFGDVVAMALLREA